jgi:spore coat polysaccharide biosynthesis protein SpsF
MGGGASEKLDDIGGGSLSGMEQAPVTAIILQARLDSSRLPAKALLPLSGEPMLFRVLQALAAIPAEHYILACPEDCLESFLPLAMRGGFAIFGGSKEDVLNRYCSAIRYFGIDKDNGARIIRATGDNPFVFADAAVKINKEAAEMNADYAGYSGLPYGAGVESVLVEALLRAEKEAAAAAEREHVCPYLYNNPSRFKIHRPPAPSEWQFPQLRLTCDTREDYENARHLYDELSAKSAPGKRYLGSEIIKHATGG